jgi:hypothetical protein
MGAEGEENLGQVGRSYWTGFMRRHGDRLVTKRGERFASNRNDWSKHAYIKQMYDVIYDEYVVANIARIRETPVYLDRSGNEVEEKDKFGEATDLDIMHPDYILFGDETGCNTSQRKDGHQAGKKYVVPRGTVPKTTCSTTDHRFTVLPITSASGHAVICVVIFQGKSTDIPSHWVSGIDTRVEPVRESDGSIKIDGECNFGEGKYFPGGPTCTYRGKTIPCATYITESGGISGEILVNILRTLDDLDVFPRVPGGPVPMLIIDGHESRLDPEFLTYINDPDHIWKVCLGVPYATNFWQVGDSAEQNGTFKTLWYREKDRVTKYNSDRSMPLTINPWDVMPIMMRIFRHSYDRPVTNRNCTSDRGWCPANRKLLSHKELKPPLPAAEGPPTNQQGQAQSSDLSSLNLENGYSTDVLDRILQYQMRNEGIARRQGRLEEGNTAVASLQEAKRLISGIMVGNGIHSLNNPMVQARVRAKQQETLDAQANAIRKQRRELLGRIEKVRQNREKRGRGENNGFINWTPRECRDYLQYKKRDADTAMPKNAGPLRGRCREVMERGSPIASPHASDDETSVREENEESLVENNELVQTEFSEQI